MSGGVDSSVAAYLTAREGYSCAGCTMRLFSNETAGIAEESGCCSLSDVEDARAVACRIGMPYYVFDFSRDFSECVIEDFLREYAAGRTPSPCLVCNRSLKFDRLLRRAVLLGYDLLVTGHYARIEEETAGACRVFHLMRAKDPAKDQSYMLYRLTQEQLSRLRFPLGGLTKAEVRAIAQEAGLVTAEKPDSQDLCFVPDGDHGAAIERLTGRRLTEGNFVDAGGKILGRHRGIERYTVGQRKGLGIPADGRLYVTEIRRETCEVVLGKEEELYTETVRLTDLHWIGGAPREREIVCSAKLRYRQKDEPAVLRMLPAERTAGACYAELIFDRPQRAPAPGQAAVFYRGDEVLGGGVILPSLGERKDRTQ